MMDPVDEFLESVIGFCGVLNALGRDMDRLSVVSAQEPVPDLHTGESSFHEIFDGGGLIDQFLLLIALPRPDSFTEHPDIGERFSREGPADFSHVFKMRKKKIHAAYLDVDGRAQVMDGCGGCGNVPGGQYVAPFRFHAYAPFEFRQCCSLEECEVPRVEFFVCIQIDGCSKANLLGIDF